MEAGAFTFDWTRLRAEVKGFVIHGTEAADKPPLFHAASVAVGLRIVSLLRRKFDIAYLDVTEPRVYLILYPDGRTNVPEPKVHSKRSTVDAILDLAVGRFSLQNGVVEVESHQPTPFSARGGNLTRQNGIRPGRPALSGGGGHPAAGPGHFRLRHPRRSPWPSASR